MGAPARKQRREVEFYKLQHESSTASHRWMARLGKLGTKKPRGASISTTCVLLSHVGRADAPGGRETLPSVDELGELEGNCHLCCAKAAAEKAAAEKAEAAAIANMRDPIQELFLTSIRAYGSSGGLASADAAAQDALKAELERVARQYGIEAGEDVTAFPSFEFSDKPVDPINIPQ